MIKRGEIYDAELNPVIGNEQGGLRPVLIVQNDTGNKHSMTTIPGLAWSFLIEFFRVTVHTILAYTSIRSFTYILGGKIHD